MTELNLPVDIMSRITQIFHALTVNVPWMLIYSIAHFVFVIVDLVFIWLIVLYMQKALSYRLKIDLRTLPPDVAEILKRSGVRERFAMRWEDLRKGAAASYRDAIVGADSLIDELLQEASFSGRDTAERFGKLNRLGLRRATVNGLFEAHRLRNRIAHEGAFVPSARVAEHALDQYARFLAEVKVIA